MGKGLPALSVYLGSCQYTLPHPAAQVHKPGFLAGFPLGYSPFLCAKMLFLYSLDYNLLYYAEDQQNDY